MSDARRLAMPWAPDRGLYCTPGRIVLKMALGEAPEAIPTARDVRSGACRAARTIDGGRVDSVLSHFTERFRVVRVHGAAAARHRAGERHVGFDDLEHAFGLARTFRLDVGASTPVGDLVDALRQVGTVEAAVPHYLCVQTALEDVATELLPEEIDEAWLPRDMIGAADALAYEPGDPAVIVAIVDTGVNRAHPELDGRLRTGFDTVQIGPQDLSNGVRLLGDLSGEDTDPDDEVGHGTGCAGIVGARGAVVPPGVAGECSILPIRVLGSARVPGKGPPVGIGALADIDDGVKRAIDLGAKVVNMSFGTPMQALDPGDPVPHADVVRYGLSRGCVMVAASGNSGVEEAFAPAVIDGVIAVGAVGSDRRPAPFSTSGDHVSVAAPGVRILSTGIDGYQRLTGTSFASPFVAGIAALLVARAARRSVPTDGRAVLRVLRESAQPFEGRAIAGHGAGIVHAASALRVLDAAIDGGGAHEPPEASPHARRESSTEETSDWGSAVRPQVAVHSLGSRAEGGQRETPWRKDSHA